VSWCTAVVYVCVCVCVCMRESERERAVWCANVIVLVICRSGTWLNTTIQIPRKKGNEAIRWCQRFISPGY